MIGKKIQPGVVILLIPCILLLSACSLSEVESDLGEFFEDILPTLSDAWSTTVQYFMGVAARFEDMLEGILAGLSGIGVGLRNMFRDFSIR